VSKSSNPKGAYNIEYKKGNEIKIILKNKDAFALIYSSP